MKISKPALMVLLAPLIISSIMLTAVNFSNGTKKDLLTGLSFGYNGFMVHDVLLIDSANKRMIDNTVK